MSRPPAELRLMCYTSGGIQGANDMCKQKDSNSARVQRITRWIRTAVLTLGFSTAMLAATASAGPPEQRDSTDPSPASHTRSEEHTSELQSLMRISYAVFSLK